jgi:hypothetical protein
MAAYNKASINISGLKKELDKKAAKAVRTKIYNQAKSVVADAVDHLLKLFNEHPITKEIEAGPDASNSSGTLGGVGNLFSHIGFEAGSEPTAAIRKYLKENLKFENVKQAKGSTDFTVTFKVPSSQQIEKLSPVPWAKGSSWVDAMEIGLSGLGQYLFKKSKASRSGSAIQVQGEIRTAQFQTQKYMSQILEEIDKYLRNALK